MAGAGLKGVVPQQQQIPRGGNNNTILPPEYERLSGSTARHGGVVLVKIEKA